MDNDSGDTPEADGHSMRYRCRYTAHEAGLYYVNLEGNSGDDYRLLVDGKEQLIHTAQEGWTHAPIRLELRQGQTISLELDYEPHTALTHVRVGIVASSDLVSEQAKYLASIADVVVIAAGFGQSNEGEGSDRAYQLPLGQRELIETAECECEDRGHVDGRRRSGS